MTFMTEERRMIQQTAREFALKEILPVANKLDPVQGDIPMSLRDKIAEMGFFGILFGEGFDAGLRIARLPDSSLIARTLCPMPRFLIGAPSFDTMGAAAQELNQPLTSVMGYAELLKRRLQPETGAYSAAEVIFNEAERMAEIVRKIGRITKYETKSYVGRARILDLDRSAPSSTQHPEEAVSSKPEERPSVAPTSVAGRGE